MGITEDEIDEIDEMKSMNITEDEIDEMKSMNITEDEIDEMKSMNITETRSNIKDYILDLTQNKLSEDNFKKIERELIVNLINKIALDNTGSRSINDYTIRSMIPSSLIPYFDGCEGINNSINEVKIEHNDIIEVNNIIKELFKDEKTRCKVWNEQACNEDSACFWTDKKYKMGDKKTEGKRLSISFGKECSSIFKGDDKRDRFMYGLEEKERIDLDKKYEVMNNIINGKETNYDNINLIYKVFIFIYKDYLNFIYNNIDKIKWEDESFIRVYGELLKDQISLIIKKNIIKVLLNKFSRGSLKKKKNTKRKKSNNKRKKSNNKLKKSNNKRKKSNTKHKKTNTKRKKNKIIGGEDLMEFVEFWGMVIGGVIAVAVAWTILFCFWSILCPIPWVIKYLGGLINLPGRRWAWRKLRCRRQLRNLREFT